MSRFALLALVACGASPVAPARPPRAVVAGHPTPPPEDPELGELEQLIRDGDLACPRIDPPGCTAFGEYAEPEPGEPATSPCSRRTRALAILDDMRPDRHVEIGSPLIARLPALDDVAVGAIGMRLSPREQVELAHRLVAAKRQIPFWLQVSEDGAAQLVRDDHVEDLIDRLTPVHDAVLLRAIAFDRTYTASARVDAMRTLDNASEPDHAALAATFRPLTGDPSCEVAAEATSIVAYVDRSVQPRRPQTRDPAVLERALCLFGNAPFGDGKAIASSFVPARGLEIVYPGGKPSELRFAGKKTLTKHPAESEWYIDELEDTVRNLGVSCATGQCRVDGRTVELELDTDAHGDLVIARAIDRPDLEVPDPPDTCP